MTFTRHDRKEIFENSIAWIVSFAMFVYGAGKLVQFEGAAAIDTPVAELTGMQLMWAFYGYSQAFVITLSILEISGGLLLLFRRTRLLGCLFTSGILVNVILQDIYFGVHLGALEAALLYQLLLLIVLWMNRERVWASVQLLLREQRAVRDRGRTVVMLLAASALFVGFRILEYYITIVW